MRMPNMAQNPAAGMNPMMNNMMMGGMGMNPMMMMNPQNMMGMMMNNMANNGNKKMA